MAYPVFSNKRKANYAFCVKFITPSSDPLRRALTALYCDLSSRKDNYLRHFTLDIFRLLGIIRLTLKLPYLGDVYHGRLWQCEIGGTWAKRHFKRPLRLCYGRVIFGQRIFRFSRPGAGQIRDASASTGRWAASFKSVKNVRLFQGFILSDKACIRRTRISRPYAPPARPQMCSQANRRYNGIYINLQNLAIDRFGKPDKTAIRLKRTPSQYRTSTAASTKKRAVNLPEPDKSLNHCTERYEQLRHMILDGREYCCQGWGLALLINRGLLAWVYAFSKIESYQQQSVVPVIPVPDKTNLAIPDTVRGRMIMTISEMVLSTLQEVAL